MKIIFKNLKNYKKAVILIIALLVIQTVCDLSLPAYTSGLIDVGLMNKGIQYAVPAKISKDTYEAVRLFMNEREEEAWINSYEEDGDGLMKLKAGLNEKELDALFAQPLAVYQMVSSAGSSGFGEGGSGETPFTFANLDFIGLLKDLKLSKKEYEDLLKALEPALDGDKLFEKYSLDKKALLSVLTDLSPEKIKGDFNFKGLINTENIDLDLLLKTFGLDDKARLKELAKGLKDEDLKELVAALKSVLNYEKIEENTGLDKDLVNLLLDSLKAENIKNLLAGEKAFGVEDYIDFSKLDFGLLQKAMGDKKPNLSDLGKANPALLERMVEAILPALNKKYLAENLGLSQEIIDLAKKEVSPKAWARLISSPPGKDTLAKAIDKDKIDYAVIMRLMASKNEGADMAELFNSDAYSREEKQIIKDAIEPAIKWDELAKDMGTSPAALKLAFRLSGPSAFGKMPGSSGGTRDFSAYIDYEKIDYKALMSVMGKEGGANFDAAGMLESGDLSPEEQAQLIKAIIPAVNTEILARETGLGKSYLDALLKQTKAEDLAKLMSVKSTELDISKIINFSEIDFSKLQVSDLAALGFMPQKIEGKAAEALKEALYPAIKWQAVSEALGLEKETAEKLWASLSAKAFEIILDPKTGTAEITQFLDFEKADFGKLLKNESFGINKLINLKNTTDAQLRAGLMNIVIALDEKTLATQLGLEKEKLAVLVGKMTAKGTENLLEDLFSKEGSSGFQEVIDSKKIDNETLMASLGLDFSNFENLLKSLPPSLRDSAKMMFAEIRASMDEKTESLGESVLRSFAIGLVAKEYEKLGIDLASMQTKYLWTRGFKMLGITLIAAIASVIVSFFASKTGASVGRDLREKVFTRVIGFSNNDIEKFSTASLITRSTNDIQQIQFVTTILLRMMLSAPILTVGGIIMVARTGANMWWVILGAIGVLLLVSAFLISITMPKFKKMQSLVDRVNLVSREMLTGLSVIRAFGREKEEEDRFEDSNKALTKTMMFTNRVMSTMFPMLMLGMYLLAIVIVWVSSKNIDAGTLQVGAMTAFITYAIMIIMGFLMLTFMSVMLPRAAVAAKRIDEVINTEPSVLDTENPLTISQKKGLVTYEDVSFAYPGAGEDTLKNISFEALPGQTTAIIGSTGSGKTTLVDLLLRF
ncbi:MAG TPA: ABC transporter transmembrane domain-containing protein, partial [Clostridiales bacterium]|nr:ABC transporter transmembrane domain-containing protein [Clostridiales bacterium]